MVGRGVGVEVSVAGIIGVGEASTFWTIAVGILVFVGATVGVTSGIPPPQADSTITIYRNTPKV